MAEKDPIETAETNLAENIVVIVPTRGRRLEVIRLIEGWKATEAVAKLVLGVDEDDRDTYPEDVLFGLAQEAGVNIAMYVLERTSMNGTLNFIAADVVRDGASFVGFMGDDHLPRTKHWDRKIVRKLVRPCSIIYGNDLFQGPQLPTAVFMDARIIQTLGYMAPPLLKHLFLDNSWKTWGEYLNTLVYMPDVIIEHMHPQAGKAEWDEGHTRVNGGEMWDHDREQWAAYSAEQLGIDCHALREASRAAA